MKLNKLFIAGLGVLAMGLVACEDNSAPEYVPAAKLDIPTAYFNYSDETQTIWDEGENTFTAKVYRAEAGAAASVAIDCSASVDFFTVPATAEFAEGATEAELEFSAPVERIEPNVEYSFKLTVPGATDTEYWLGSKTYTARYVPWINMNNALGEPGYYTDDFFYSAYGVDGYQWEVVVEQNPFRPGLFRLPNPYALETNAYIQYTVAESDQYMYVNAENPDSVFLCNREGEATRAAAFFRGGVEINASEGAMTAICLYTYYLATGTEGEPSQCGTLKGTNMDNIEGYNVFKGGYITFPERSFLLQFTVLEDQYYSNTDGAFCIEIPGTVNLDRTWTSLGNGQFTDGALRPFFGDQAETYEVEVQQNEGNKALYRIVNPYASYVGGTPEEDVYLVFDTSNPQCVLMDVQYTGVDIDDPINLEGQSLFGQTFIMNSAGYDLNVPGTTVTPEEIIAKGENDVMEGNTITLNQDHIYLYFPDAVSEYMYKANAVNPSLATNTVLVLPNASAAEAAAAVAKAKASAGTSTGGNARRAKLTDSVKSNNKLSKSVKAQASSNVRIER